MIEFIDWFWELCIYVLQFLGGSPGNFGLGYKLANILIFVILQPLLIVLFIMLWRRERKIKLNPNHD